MAELDGQVEGTPVADGFSAYIRAANADYQFKDIPGLSLPTDVSEFRMGQAVDLKNTEEFTFGGNVFPPKAKQLTYVPIVVEADVCGECTAFWKEDVSREIYYQGKWVNVPEVHPGQWGGGVKHDGAPEDGSWVTQAKISNPREKFAKCTLRIFFIDVAMIENDVADPPGVSLRRQIVDSRFEVRDGGTTASWLVQTFTLGAREEPPHGGFCSFSKMKSDIIPEYKMR